MKNQEEKKESVLGAIKKYKLKKKQNLLRRKNLQSKLRDRVCRCGLRAAPIIFYYKIGSRKKESITTKSSIIML
jgi:hypothetical protein